MSALILMAGNALVGQFTCPAFMAGDVPVKIAGKLTAEHRANPDGFRVKLDTDDASRPYGVHVSVDVAGAQAGKALAFVRLPKDSDPHWISFRLTAPGGAEGLAVTQPHIRVTGDAPSGGSRELLSADCTLVNSGTAK